MTVKELAERMGITPHHLFKRAYTRHGLLFSIGNVEETYPRYEKSGYIPVYVARFVREEERKLLKEPSTDEQLPLFI